MKRIHIIEASVAISLILSVVLSVVGFGFECKNIRNNVVRLHILANSNKTEDQNIKLVVRDALLNCGSELFSGNVRVENAEIILNDQKDFLLSVVNNALEEYRFDYKANIYLTKEYFSTRSYDSFTLPAGEYLALKVILGEGEGKNWWCVMFPPLCIPAATEKTPMDIYVGESGAEIIQNHQGYEMRFKIIEVYEGIKSHIKNKIYSAKQSSR